MDNGEIRDIVISWLVVSIAFGYVMKGAFSATAKFPMDFAMALVVAMVATGTGFILHELAHRTVAIKFGAKARYVAWPAGLGFALLLAFVSGMVFAAPGAVYIFGKNINRKQNGLISLAGPATNVLLGIIFFIAAIFLGDSFLGLIAYTGARINFWLATFNLIPIFPLDGSKVFAWQPLLWGIIFVPMAIIALLF